MFDFSIQQCDFLDEAKNLKKDYCDLLSDNFAVIENRCTIKFNKKVLKIDSCPAFYAYAVCKHNNCKKYKFIIERFSSDDPNEFLECSVFENKSDIDHSDGKKFRRKLVGHNRNIAAKFLAKNNYNITMTTMKQWQSASSVALESGNLTGIHSMKILSNVKAEIENGGKHCKTDAEELMALQKYYLENDNESKKMKGFIWNLTFEPFSFVLATEMQLRCLKKLADLNDLIIFIDATGSICNVPDTKGKSKTLLMYVIMAKGKNINVPIATFFTVSNKALDVQSFFTKVNLLYSKLFQKMFKPNLTIMDNSLALIYGTILSFNSMKLDFYLLYMWRLQKEDIALPSGFSLVHLCGGHFIRQCRDKIKKIGGINSQLNFFIIGVICILIYSVRLEDQEDILKAFATVLGNKFLSPVVEESKKSIVDRIKSKKVENHQEAKEDSKHDSLDEEIVLLTDKDIKIKSNSPYYKELKPMMEKQFGSQGSLINDFYCPKFLTYFIEFCLYILPLWTAIALSLHSSSFLSDDEKEMITTNIVEGHIKVKKVNVLEKKKYSKAHKVIEKFHAYDSGKAKQFCFVIRI